MAITLTVTEAYATLSEADIYLENNSDWNGATDEDKTEALLDSRYYIDVNWYCDLSTYDTIPDELKYANAVLAGDLISDPESMDAGPNTKKKFSKAGSVATMTEYFSGAKNKPKSVNKVKGILQDLCSRRSGSARLTRA